LTKAIVAISDLHIGSHSGLCPEYGIHLDDGSAYTPSKFQSYVWRCWTHFWDGFVADNTRDCESVTVVVNGDVIDGNHHQSPSLIGNVQDQERAAIELLSVIRAKYPLYMVRGTEAHGGLAEQSTERVARALQCPQDEAGNYSSWQLWLTVCGVTFQFAHHIGTTSSAAYETSAPMRELVAGLVEAAQWGHPLADVYVRSHRHRYIPVSIPAANDKDIQLVITPAWQLRTPHVERIDRMRLPHIGGIVFKMEDGNCQTIKKLYEMPKPEPIRI